MSHITSHNRHHLRGFREASARLDWDPCALLDRPPMFALKVAVGSHASGGVRFVHPPRGCLYTLDHTRTYARNHVTHSMIYTRPTLHDGYIHASTDTSTQLHSSYFRDAPSAATTASPTLVTPTTTAQFAQSQSVRTLACVDHWQMMDCYHPACLCDSTHRAHSRDCHDVEERVDTKQLCRKVTE